MLEGRLSTENSFFTCEDVAALNFVFGEGGRKLKLVLTGVDGIGTPHPHEPRRHTTTAKARALCRSWGPCAEAGGTCQAMPGNTPAAAVLGTCRGHISGGTCQGTCPANILTHAWAHAWDHAWAHAWHILGLKLETDNISDHLGKGGRCFPRSLRQASPTEVRLARGESEVGSDTTPAMAAMLNASGPTQLP